MRETESLGHSERKFALTLFLFEPDFYVVLKVLPKQTFIEELSFQLSNLRFRMFYCDWSLLRGVLLEVTKDSFTPTGVVYIWETNVFFFFHFTGAKFGFYNPLYTIVLYKKERVCGYHWYQISFRQCGQWIIGIEILHPSHNRGFNKPASFTYNRSFLWHIFE